MPHRFVNGNASKPWGRSRLVTGRGARRDAIGKLSGAWFSPLKCITKARFDNAPFYTLEWFVLSRKTAWWGERIRHMTMMQIVHDDAAKLPWRSSFFLVGWLDKVPHRQFYMLHRRSSYRGTALYWCCMKLVVSRPAWAVLYHDIRFQTVLTLLLWKHFLQKQKIQRPTADREYRIWWNV